jgi:glucose-6-phosphate 1-dehydrogenase
MKTNDVIFVLFGATGDLAQKKILPALSALFADKSFSAQSKVVSVSRRDWDDAAFAGEVGTYLGNSGVAADPAFRSALAYAKIDIDAGTGYDGLAQKISTLKKDLPQAQVVIYLSLAPQFHPKVILALFETGVLARGGAKILIEKPFGTDSKTAQELNDLLLSKLDEADIYRIDHYLGKQASQGIMDLPEKCREISSITARIFEEKGIDGRGESYDGVGAFRDVGQNHMLEMVALVLASAQCSRGGDWQEARSQVLVRLVPPANTCLDFRRGQYDGYLAEKGVRAGSQTETAFKVVTMLGRTHIALESGKKMPSSEASVSVVYKDGTTEKFHFKAGADAYQTMIRAALAGSKREFVGKDEVLALWSYADRARDCWGQVPLEIYSEKKPFLIQ